MWAGRGLASEPYSGWASGQLVHTFLPSCPCFPGARDIASRESGREMTGSGEERPCPNIKVLASRVNSLASPQVSQLAELNGPFCHFVG